MDIFSLFQNNLLPSGEKARMSKTLVIESVDRHEAGTYVCEAHNGVGNQRATAHIRLQVLCEFDPFFGIPVKILGAARHIKNIFN